MLLLVYPASTLQNISLSLAGPPPFGLLTCSLSTLRRVTLPGPGRRRMCFWTPTCRAHMFSYCCCEVMIGKCCDNLDIKVAPNGSIFAPVTPVTKLLAKHYRVTTINVSRIWIEWAEWAALSCTANPPFPGHVYRRHPVLKRFEHGGSSLHFVKNFTLYD